MVVSIVAAYLRNKVRKRMVVATALAAFVALSSTHAQTSDFLDPVKTGTRQTIQTAIARGADVNARDGDGVNALMYAVQFNPNPEVISILLQAGADLRAQNKYGVTALMGAAPTA